MSLFLKARIATLIWGFTISYLFTGKLITAGIMFSIMAIGNTIIMWIFWDKNKK